MKGARTAFERAVKLATADAVRVSVSSSHTNNLRFAANQVSTAGDNFNTTVVVRSVFGRRAGTATTNSLDDAALRTTVQNAERIARLAPEDPEFMPELGPQTYAEPVGWSETTATLDPEGRAAAVAAITGIKLREIGSAD